MLPMEMRLLWGQQCSGIRGDGLQTGELKRKHWILYFQLDKCYGM